MIPVEASAPHATGTRTANQEPAANQPPRHQNQRPTRNQPTTRNQEPTKNQQPTRNQPGCNPKQTRIFSLLISGISLYLTSLNFSVTIFIDSQLARRPNAIDSGESCRKSGRIRENRAKNLESLGESCRRSGRIRENRAQDLGESCPNFRIIWENRAENLGECWGSRGPSGSDAASRFALVSAVSKTNWRSFLPRGASPHSTDPRGIPYSPIKQD